MKNNKGITLISLVIYIALIFVITAIIMRVTTHFGNNMEYVANVTFETEFQKINLYLLGESKRTENGVLQITEDGMQVTFGQGNIYTYRQEEKKIYLNNTIKICENIENCLFEKNIAENGRDILVLTIKIGNIEKIVQYVITTQFTTTALLPNEYQQVEYIESTGTQYIDTKLNLFNYSTYKIEMDFTPTSFYNYNAICGTANGTTTHEVWIDNLGNFYFRYNGIKPSAVVLTANQRIKISLEYDGTNVKIYINDVLKTSYASSESLLDSELYLLHRENTTNYGKDKIYSVKIYGNDVLLRDYIACYRKSDNVSGLYDLSNEQFYTNAGTGTFEKGNDVNVVVADKGNQEYINEEDYIIDMVIENEKILLPSEYQQVEYIKTSSANEYINTKLVFKPGNKLEMKILPSSANKNSFALGAVANYNSNNNLGCQFGKEIIWTRLTSYSISTDTYVFSSQYLGDCIIYNMDGTKIVELAAEYPNLEFYIFKANEAGKAMWGNNDNLMYYCKIWEGNTLVRNFIPCYRKTDNVVGLYDTVNNEFYTNAGTGTFEKGADVNENIEEDNDLLPAAYKQVEYIESTGTQYINTGFIPNSNTSIEMKASNKSTTNTCLYCARGITGYQDNTYTAFLINGNLLRVDYYNKSYDNIMTVNNDTIFIYKQSKNLVYINGENIKTLEENDFSSQYNMYLMVSKRGEEEPTNIGQLKVYYCKIWDGEKLVRDFIPCYRKTDNVVGLYDTVNDVFYTNVGTGNFNVGPNV